MIEFSFRYGDKTYRSNEMKPADVTETRRSDCIETIEIYLAEELRVTRVARSFGPGEYSLLRFENTSASNSKALSQIFDLDERDPLLLCSPPDGFNGYGNPDYTRLIRVFGSNGDDREFDTHAEAIRAGKSCRFGPKGGRSSQGFAPFFEVCRGNEGYLAAIGWSGQWFAEVAGEGGDVRVRAGVDGLCFYLKPGESVRTASVLKVPYSGGSVAGHNAFKRLLKDSFAPRLPDGLPFYVSFWGGCTSEFLIEQLELIESSKAPFDAFWLDAGWYGHHRPERPGQFDDSWGGQTGSWKPNRLLHPDGLESVAKKVKSLGMKFMLWFEPERVCLPSDWAEEHADLLLRAPGINWCALLDLSRPEGQDVMYGLIAGEVERLGLDFYRQDFNVDPLPMWESGDEPGRKGVVQLKYVEGLYRVWDRLRGRFPHLIIDNCASGGRRIDLETLSRSVPIWRSDYQCSFDADAEAAQNHNMGISAWIPYSATGIGQFVYDRYIVRSCYAAAANTSCFGYEHLADRTADAEKLNRTVQEFHEVRDYFSCDYYPIFAGARDHASWGGWQFNRPEHGDGILMAFRRDRSPFSSTRAVLGGLLPDRTYEFESRDGEPARRYTGRELMEQGLPLEIPARRDSRLYLYRLVDGE